MKNIKKTLLQTLFIGCMIMLGSSVFAQQGGQRPDGPPPGGERRGPEQMFERNLQFLVDSIQIDEAQQEKVKAINTTYQKKMESLQSEMRNTEDRSQMREKFSTTMEAYNTEVAKVLTPEQKAKYDEAQERRRKRFEQRRREDGDNPPPADSRRQRGNRDSE